MLTPSDVTNTVAPVPVPDEEVAIAAVVPAASAVTAPPGSVKDLAAVKVALVGNAVTTSTVKPDPFPFVVVTSPVNVPTEVALFIPPVVLLRSNTSAASILPNV